VYWSGELRDRSQLFTGLAGK